MGDDERVRELERDLAHKSEQVATLGRIAVELGGTLDLEPLLHRILQSLDEVFGFAHSMVLLCDPERNVLVVKASHGYGGSGVGSEVPVGVGVVGVVARRKKLMRMGGVSMQQGYLLAAGSGAAVTNAVSPPGLPDVASVVGIPLVRRDDLVGVFYVESQKLAAFDDLDLALIEGVASLAAVAIQNAQYHEKERKRVEQLEQANQSLMEWNDSSRQFVPYEFLSILGRTQLPDVRRGDHAELTMSTFFSDVRAYTTLVEGQGAEENFAFINEYLTYMEAPISARQGFIDSYRGDGILALFPGRGDDAVGAATDSLRALERLNQVRVARGEPSLRIGIGIDTGPLMLGTIGGEARLSASVIGDAVNTAARVESLTKRYGASVLITDRTLAACAERNSLRVRAVDRVRPKGKSNSITLYELLDGLPADELSGKLAALDDFEHGYALYQEGKAGEGLVHFAAALKTFPGDRAAQLYVGRCWQFIENGVPEGWDGVVTLTTKR